MVEVITGPAGMTSIVAVLGTGVVDATARSAKTELSLVVGTAVEKDGGRVKARRAAQVTGFSPCEIRC